MIEDLHENQLRPMWLPPVNIVYLTHLIYQSIQGEKPELTHHVFRCHAENVLSY